MATPSSQQSDDLAKAKTKDDPSHANSAGSDTKSDDKDESNATKLTTSDCRRRTRAGSGSDADSLFDETDKRSRSSSVESSVPEDNPRAIIMPIVDPNAEVVITPQVIAAAERLVSASALVHQDMIAQQESLDRKIAAMEERLDGLLQAMRDSLLSGLEDDEEETGKVEDDEEEGSEQA